MKHISILGSTGSIGTQALDVISNVQNKFKLVGLSAGKNITLFKEQLLKFKPEHACIQNENMVAELKNFISKHQLKITLHGGKEGLKYISSIKQDLVIVAIVGTAGILPTYHAIQAKNNIGLACKEVLVSAGSQIKKLVDQHNVRLLPIDSEHAAIQQCLFGYSIDNVSHIVLTASGGPFRGFNSEELRHVQVEDALKHPKWTMGKKITIDSATLANKGLEVIEAHYLFQCPYEKIKIKVHPQCLVHGIVEFNDGNIISHLSQTDMRIPIQYVLTYPEKYTSSVQKMDWNSFQSLTFEEPDLATFSMLKLAYEVGKMGGNYPAVYNAANEAAVELFLNKKIGFSDIYSCVRQSVETFKDVGELSVMDVIELDNDIKNKMLYVS